MSCLGPLNIWSKDTAENQQVELEKWRVFVASAHLDLLDVILDPFDGVSVEIVPRIDLLLSDHFCSDHCNRGRGGRFEQKQRFGGIEGSVLRL